MSVIDIRGLSFAYAKQVVLEDINLTVERKDFLAIIGPNGGGKSTLLKLILGIYEYSNGTITILSDKSKNSSSQIGYVPQDTNINIDFPIRVIEVVLMGYKSKKRRLFGYGKDELNSAISALEQVGMEGFVHHKIGSLSGGQRQRVMIARALCANPEILILDEPTSSIDIGGQKEVYQLLKRLNKEITIIVVSHDISVILEYANRVAHINRKLSYHDISDREHNFSIDNTTEHFCEVELLEMLGSEQCIECSESKCEWSSEK